MKENISDDHLTALIKIKGKLVFKEPTIFSVSLIFLFSGTGIQNVSLSTLLMDKNF